jgi:hypothetical protein
MGIERKNDDNTFESMRQLGRKSACRRGMMGGLYFIFSDVMPNFDSLPFSLVKIFMSSM